MTTATITLPLKERASNVLRNALYRFRSKRARLAIALRYAMGKTTEADAQTLMFEMQGIAGVWALEIIDVEGVLASARDRWGDHLGMEQWAHEASSRVWSKWGGDGHVTDAAQGWALDLIEQYAASEGVTLNEVE